MTPALEALPIVSEPKELQHRGLGSRGCNSAQSIAGPFGAQLESAPIPHFASFKCQWHSVSDKHIERCYARLVDCAGPRQARNKCQLSVPPKGSRQWSRTRGRGATHGESLVEVGLVPSKRDDLWGRPYGRLRSFSDRRQSQRPSG